MPRTIAPPDFGVVVRDAEAMLRFYRDALGLPPVRELALAPFPLTDASVDPVGVAWYLDTGAGKLKLLCLNDVPTASNPAGPHRVATGLRYLSFGVEDVEATVASCLAAGGRICQEATPFGTSKVAFLFDPDGNVVELVQRA